MDDTEFKKLRRASTASALVSASGFVILILSVVFSYMQVQEAQETVTALETQADELNDDIIAYKQQIADLEAASSPDAIIAQNTTVRLDGIRDAQERQIYDFTIWLQVPILLKDQIDHVTYAFDHISKLRPNQTSSTYANGYAISYRGWGCFSGVVITVHLKDGGEHKLEYDQCDNSQRVLS